MQKEYILDIGIGTGGNYIQNNRDRSIERIGLDIDEDKLKILKYSYPEVLAVKADAHDLPFKDNTFSGIEFILPAGSLITGLQNHFNIENHNDEYVLTSKNGDLYKEFQRVLKPGGEIQVYTDFLLHPKTVTNASKKYFTTDEIKRLSVSEFEALGTFFTKTILSVSNSWSREKNKRWQSRLLKIKLKSKKTS